MIIIKPGTLILKLSETVLPGFVEYTGDPIPTDEHGAFLLDNYVALVDPPYLRVKTEVELKAEAAIVKIEEIYREQEIRSANIDMLSGDKLGFEMPRTVIDILEETYLQILVPAARQAITAAAPFWFDIKQLRDNRNTLLAGLQAWIDNPAKTAQDILDFDVENWTGWDVDRPA